MTRKEPVLSFAFATTLDRMRERFGAEPWWPEAVRIMSSVNDEYRLRAIETEASRPPATRALREAAEAIEQVLTSMDWIGTGSSQQAADDDQRKAWKAWSTILSALGDTRDPYKRVYETGGDILLASPPVSGDALRLLLAMTSIADQYAKPSGPARDLVNEARRFLAATPPERSGLDVIALANALAVYAGPERRRLVLPTNRLLEAARAIAPIYEHHLALLSSGGEDTPA